MQVVLETNPVISALLFYRGIMILNAAEFLSILER